MRPFNPREAEIDICDLARRLIGARLLFRGVGGIILETEAYGRHDPASHSFRGPGRRNAVMFGPAGHAYIYRSYGLHDCLNVVGRPGEAVLIRALEPQIGVAQMRLNRPKGPLCAGPGRLAQALGITAADNGKPFDGTEFSLMLSSGPAPALLTGPRIGISRATELAWRFGLAGAAGMSRPFPRD